METNLKCRQCLVETAEMSQDDSLIGAFNGEIICETPNNLLNKFEGMLDWKGKRYVVTANVHILHRTHILHGN
jgi:phospholipid-translocating ATPase